MISKEKNPENVNLVSSLLNSLRSSGPSLNFANFFRPLAEVQEIGVFIGLVCISLFFSLAAPYFFSTVNLLRVVRQVSFIAIMAIGMVFVMSIGEIDLSVGSLYNLVQVITAFVMQKYGVNIWLAVGLGLLVGTFCGFLNGGLGTILRIPMIIITLGTMSVFRGISLVICHGRALSNFPKNNAFFSVGGGFLWQVPMSVIVMALMGTIFLTIYTRTTLGRHTCAVGSNIEAARVTGIRIIRTRLIVMALMGFITAVSGLMGFAFLQTADPSVGQGYELQVIAAVVIGGTALKGGSGTIIGALLGAIIIGVINNGLLLMGVTMYWSTMVTGIVIIVAVAINSLVKGGKQV